jgi:SAM-dependent methyltransferase
MTTNSSALESYRGSHASEGYGGHYDLTYRQGYYFYQWEYLEKPLLEKVLAAVPGRESKAYLDFACGTGRIISVGAEFFHSATGVDISESMLREARVKVGTAEFIQRDITSEPLNRHFDVITAFRFFLNAEPQLSSAVLRELHALLNPDGLLITNIHMNSASVTGLAYRLRNKLTGRTVANVRSFADFSRELESHGFRITQVHWYSVLPRTGWRLGWLPKYFMKPVEAMAKKVPGLAKFSQNFLVVCEKVGS